MSFLLRCDLLEDWPADVGVARHQIAGCMPEKFLLIEIVAYMERAASAECRWEAGAPS
jgi:hypothetical protein